MEAKRKKFKEIEERMMNVGNASVIGTRKGESSY